MLAALSGERMGYQTILEETRSDCDSCCFSDTTGKVIAIGGKLISAMTLLGGLTFGVAGIMTRDVVLQNVGGVGLIAGGVFGISYYFCQIMNTENERPPSDAGHVV